MSSLLKAGFRRYIRHPFTWIALAATIIVAIMNGSWVRQWYIDDIYVIYQLFIYAVLFTWLIGREYEEGIFRNKIVIGHRKGSIFISELILALCIGVVLFLVHTAIFAMFNAYVFKVIPGITLFKIFIDIMLTNIVFIIIFIIVSSMLPQRAIGVILSIVLIFGIYAVGYSLDGILYEEEYTYTIVMTEVEKVDEDGVRYKDWEESIKDVEENPMYVEGWLRTCVEVAANIVPNTHQMDYFSMLLYYFGYENFDDEHGMSYEEAYPSMIKISQQENQMINENLIYSVVILLIVGMLGYVLFRKKDFK